MSSVPRELHSELIYAAAAANAWLRGMSIPLVALHYRYEPITALHLIRRCHDQYGDLSAWVPDSVFSVCSSEERDSLPFAPHPDRRRRSLRIPRPRRPPAARSPLWTPLSLAPPISGIPRGGNQLPLRPRCASPSARALDAASALGGRRLHHGPRFSLTGAGRSAAPAAVISVARSRSRSGSPPPPSRGSPAPAAARAPPCACWITAQAWPPATLRVPGVCGLTARQGARLPFPLLYPFATVLAVQGSLRRWRALDRSGPLQGELIYQEEKEACVRWPRNARSRRLQISLSLRRPTTSIGIGRSTPATSADRHDTLRAERTGMESTATPSIASTLAPVSSLAAFTQICENEANRRNGRFLHNEPNRCRPQRFCKTNRSTMGGGTPRVMKMRAYAEP
jgi:hypothetical protein